MVYFFAELDNWRGKQVRVTARGYLLMNINIIIFIFIGLITFYHFIRNSQHTAVYTFAGSRI